MEPVVPEAHESVSLPEPQPATQHEPVVPEPDKVEHEQAVEPSEPLQTQPENELRNSVEPTQQPEMDVESIPQQPESGIEPEQQPENGMEPVQQPEMDMETSQPQENCKDSTQSEQTIVAPSDTPKPKSTISLESFKSLFLTVPFVHTF